MEGVRGSERNSNQNQENDNFGDKPASQYQYYYVCGPKTDGVQVPPVILILITYYIYIIYILYYILILILIL